MRKVHAMAALGKIQELKEILDSGVSVDDMDCNGNTPLYYATLFERKNSLDLLESLGADYNLKDENGLTQQYRAHKDALEAVVNAVPLRRSFENVRFIK
jgi:hypothetical protein